MNRIARALLLLTSAGASTLAAPQGLAGITVGAYFPADQEIRDLIGTTFFQFGFSPNVGVGKKKFDVRPEFVLLSGAGKGNRFSIYAIPITVIMPLAMGQKDVPYIAAGAGPTYFDYNITRAGPVNFRDSGIGFISHVEAGMVFGDRMRLSARYNMLGEKDGFSFNGIQVGLSWQFVRL